MPTKFNGLDHLRALAILFVFLFHYYILSKGQPEWLPNVASFGWTGVDLFFVLSGFLISFQLFAQIKNSYTISLKSFFIKRFFRIIPLYLVTVMLYFCFPIFHEKESLPPLWKFLTFTQNFGLYIKDYGTFSHCWSLCVEEHFYLLLPFTLAILLSYSLFKKAYWILIVLFLAGFLFRLYSYNSLYLPKSNLDFSWAYWYEYIYYPTYNRLDGLLVGVAIAGFYQFLPTLWHKISRYGNALIALGVLFLSSAYFLCEDQMTFNASVFGFPLIALGYGCVVMGAISPTSFLYKWKSNITSLIATLSFGVYLTHKGVIHVTHELLATYTLNPNLLLCISIATCFAFAYLLYLIVEKPFLKIRNRIIQQI